MSEEISQKTIEHFFKKCKVTDEAKKAAILPNLTDLIYDYNMSVVEYEKEQDKDRKEQILEEINEMEDKIMETCQG